MDPLAAAAAVLLALLSGGLVAALVGVRKAPVEEATAVSQAATAHAGVLLADNEDLRAQLERLVDELAAVRRDWARDREEARQLREANEGLVVEIDFLHAQRHGRESPQ